MPITPAFVAEARRTYVPAAKWARANGATFHRKKWSTFSDSRWIKDGSCVIWRRPWLCFHEDSLNKRFDVCPTSVEQAIDYLVTAGVMPVPMHSLMQVDAETAAYEATMPEVYGSAPVHRCGHDCPPVGVAGAVPTGEVYDPTATPPELAIMGRLLPWTVQACADLDHPIGIYNARTNASYCVCGAAMVSGDYRQGVTS